MSLYGMEMIAVSFSLDLLQLATNQFIPSVFCRCLCSAENLNSKIAFYCNLLSLLMQTIIEPTCFYGNKTDKVFQETRVIDYTCMLCHIQLTQSDCTPHYATTCKKINKYGWYPIRFPPLFLSFIPYDGSKAKTDHATRMSLLLQEAGAV